MPNIIIHLNNFLTLIWNEIHLTEITKESMMSEPFKHFKNIWIGHTVLTKTLGIPFCVESKGFQDMTTHCLETDKTTNLLLQTNQSALFFEAAAISIVCKECNHRLKR